MKKADLNVLIVEDDKTQRAALLEAVQRRGYKAIAVGKADEAESVVRIKPVHMAIVDCMLPGRNGVDLAVKLKENMGDNAGLLFVSGIFRDKSFAQETIRKTGAIDFLFKPYDMNELLRIVDTKLQEYLEVPKIDLHALLSAPFASGRERKKALDHVEELSGFDLPFVFSILMESESSGHLNIVDQNQNIYGVTFAKGAIAKVDSEATGLHTKKILVTHGYITELELNEVTQKVKASDLEKTLVEEGYISPHVPGLIKMETVVNELNKLIKDQTLNINFVPDRKLKEDRDNIDIASFTPQLHDMIDKMITGGWLKKFYEAWAGHPIQLGPQFKDFLMYSQFDVFQRVPKIDELLKKRPTIDEILATPEYREDDVYRALHFLAVRRLIVFEEVRRVKDVEEHVARIRSTHAALSGKDPFQIFAYFGLGDSPKANDVIRVYKDFSKSFHPDTLPQSVTDEVRSLNMDLFSNVTTAYDTLSNDEKKQQYIETRKLQDAEKQLKSDELVSLALLSLERGRYSEALPILEQAAQIYLSERCWLHLYWARLKVDGKVRPSELSEVDRKLKSMPPATKSTALHVFLVALVKKVMGDKAGAFEGFQRVLSLQEDFMDARRELAGLKSGGQKQSSQDFLKGDLKDVLGGLFGKKKKGA